MDGDDPYWNGFGWSYEGEVMGLDFSAEGLVTNGTTFRCADGTLYHNVFGETDLWGRFSEGEREFKGALRISWRQASEGIDLDTLTWVWTATRR